MVSDKRAENLGESDIYHAKMELRIICHDTKCLK